MIQFNTDRGQFNITESLYKAIQENNPEILMEEKSSKYMTIVNSIERYGIENLPEDIDNQINQVSDKTERQQLKDMIKNKRSKVDMYNKRLNQSQNDKSTDDQTNQLSDENKVYAENLETLLHSEELHQQIKDAERITTGIVKRAKRVIHTAVGIMGSHTSPTASTFKGGKNNSSTTTQPDGTQGTQTSKPNKSTSSTHVDTSVNDYYHSSSGAGRKILSTVKLAGGGFKFSPLFGDLKSPLSGKALKYYKSAQRPTEHSYIDNMIDILVSIKSNPSMYKGIKESNKQAFEKMAYSYLHNVVYKLEINNDKKFTSVVNALRLDNALNDLFDVTNVNTVQLFDTKEQVISFRDKKSGIISMIIIAVPMFAHGKEIWNNLKPIWGYMQNIKG